VEEDTMKEKNTTKKLVLARQTILHLKTALRAGRINPTVSLCATECEPPPPPGTHGGSGCMVC
jgi:hypothetical protein